MDGATEDSKEEGQDGGNTPTVNDKQVGEEEEKEEGNNLKMEEDFKTSTEYDNIDAVNTPEMDGATEDSKEEGQDGGIIPTVNDKQAGEEEEKGGENTTKMEEVFKTSTVNDKRAGEEEEKGRETTPKMDEDFKTSTEYDNKDAVNTPEMDGTTEDSKEEEHDEGNIPTVNDKQAGEEEEKEGGTTPKMEEDFKTSTGHNGKCDSEQDADNLPSWLNGTNIWQFFSFLGYLILLIGILTPAVAFANPASNPHNYAADPGSTQGSFLCDHFGTPLINTTGIFDIKSKSRCYCESKKKKCPSGFDGFCLPLVTEKQFIAGCINTTGLYLHGEKCLLVTIVQGYNKYKAECHDEKCPTCTNANSLEERLKMCLFKSKTSGDSHSTVCTPKTSSTTGVQPTYWILGLGIAVVLFMVLTSQ